MHHRSSFPQQLGQVHQLARLFPSAAMTTRANDVPMCASRRSMQRAEGAAAVLAIGTANPSGTPGRVHRPIVPHNQQLPPYWPQGKAGENICKKTGIEKRYFHLSEEILRAHTEFLDTELPSLDARIDMASAAVAELAVSAAVKAIAEWGRPATDITHLVFSTFSGCRAPGDDLKLASLLGLRPCVSRTVLGIHACTGAARALHLAKELAENNRGARVLVACSETTLVSFHGPDGSNLVGHALFGDGAGAAVVGAGPLAGGERPLFEMVAAAQMTIPGTEDAVGIQVTGGGLDFQHSIQLPMVLRQNVERCLRDAFKLATGDGGGDGDGGDATSNWKWNDLFWAVHPGGRSILDNIEAVLKLEPGKLAASRRVLREYGNMSSTSCASTGRRTVASTKSCLSGGQCWASDRESQSRRSCCAPRAVLRKFSILLRIYNIYIPLSMPCQRVANSQSNKAKHLQLMPYIYICLYKINLHPPYAYYGLKARYISIKKDPQIFVYPDVILLSYK
ncbi:hypothetical protein ACP4OV_025628 [Aristida adscensionis]